MRNHSIDETAAALDAALQDKLGRFSAASRQYGVQVTVHSRPTFRSWLQSGQNFTQKMVLGVALVAAGWGASSAFDVSKPGSSTSAGPITNVQAEQTEAVDSDQGWRAERFERLRGELRYIEVKTPKSSHVVLDINSRIALVKSAAEDLKLHEHGLTWQDLYGLIHAETGWIDRDGMGKNAVTSMGLAQFEPSTAKSIGIDNPRDPIQAVYGAGMLLNQAADWSAMKVRKNLRHHKLKKETLHVAFKEGVSIFYNTSSQLRNSWDASNTQDFPEETQRHIKNTREGAKAAVFLERSVKSEVAKQVATDESQLRRERMRAY